MARYWVDAPFTYTDAGGNARLWHPLDNGRIFDTTNAAVNIPAGWTPSPGLCLRPMDSVAQAALTTAITAAQAAIGNAPTPPGLEDQTTPLAIVSP
jgi:hypothetical protein